MHFLSSISFEISIFSFINFHDIFKLIKIEMVIKISVDVSTLDNFLIFAPRYFANLQKELESYDCVLYEMVASREILENRRNPAATKRLKSSRSRGFNILGCIQRQMARVLMLDFQLDCLDYQAESWYHADLDYETFKLLQV